MKSNVNFSGYCEAGEMWDLDLYVKIGAGDAIKSLTGTYTTSAGDQYLSLDDPEWRQDAEKIITVEDILEFIVPHDAISITVKIATLGGAEYAQEFGLDRSTMPAPSVEIV